MAYWDGGSRYNYTNNNRARVNRRQGNQPQLRSNGMRQDFGPQMIPEGSFLRIAGYEPENVDEEPTVEIKQTIRTEYKIKKEGVIYVGAINETNIWGSHQHPEF